MDIEEIIKKPGTVVLDIYADWCKPCKVYSPILDELQQELPNIEVEKVNIEGNEQFALDNQVMAVPTTLVYKDGQLVKRIIGAKKKEVIRKELEQL